jgi:hypothetical protein
MKTNNPMKALLTLTFFRTRNALLIGIVGAVVPGLAFLASEVELLFMMFAIFCMSFLPMQVFSGLGDDEGRCERLQITMPIKRSDLLKVQYISVLFVAGIGALILTAGIGASTALLDEFFINGFASAIGSSLHIYGMGFLAIGLMFTLSSFIPSGIAGLVGFMIPAVIVGAVSGIGDDFGGSIYVLSGAILGVSVLIFAISYFLTKSNYNKMDF